MIAEIFWRNQILTGIVIDQIHCLVVESNFCYAESTAYYTIHNKPDHSFEYQPHEFEDKLIE